MSIVPCDAPFIGLFFVQQLLRFPVYNPSCFGIEHLQGYIGIQLSATSFIAALPLPCSVPLLIRYGIPIFIMYDLINDQIGIAHSLKNLQRIPSAAAFSHPLQVEYEIEAMNGKRNPAEI